MYYRNKYFQQFNYESVFSSSVTLRRVSGISVDDIGAITVHGRRESNAEDNTLLEVRCRQVVIATCPPRAKQLTDSIVFNGTVPGGEEVSKIDIPTARRFASSSWLLAFIAPHVYLCALKTCMFACIYRRPQP